MKDWEKKMGIVKTLGMFVLLNDGRWMVKRDTYLEPVDKITEYLIEAILTQKEGAE